MSARFKALVVREARAGGVTRAVEERAIDDLPPGDTLIRVRYSSLNYKDALSAAGHRGITRRYPHTPGIDAAGVVVESTSRAFAAGSEVIVTGYDLGMNTSGGFAQYILDAAIRECALDDLESEIGNMLAGEMRGRVPVTLAAPATQS